MYNYNDKGEMQTATSFPSKEGFMLFGRPLKLSTTSGETSGSMTTLIVGILALLLVVGGVVFYLKKSGKMSIGSKQVYGYRFI